MVDADGLAKAALPILEDMRMSALLLQPGDAEGLRPFVADLERLQAAMEGADARVIDALDALMATVREGLEGGGLEPAELRDEVEALAELIANPTVEEEAELPPSAGVFELPPWVDESLYSEFISIQRMAIEELEASFVALEQGEEVDIPDLKRRLHTLKGESGTVGIEDLAQVYHAVENLFDEVEDLTQCVEPALAAIDWLNAALKSYSELLLPSVPVADVLAQLAGDVAADPEPEDEAPSVAPVALPPDMGEEDPDRAVVWDEETAELLGEFLTEATEGVETADRILLEADRKEPDLDNVNALFRVFHSIKGVAGFLGVDCVISLAHSTETLLNKAREKEIEFSGDVVDLVFEATNAMRELLEGVRLAFEASRALPSDAPYQRLIERLNETGGVIAPPPRSVAKAGGAAAQPQAPAKAAAQPPAPAKAAPRPASRSQAAEPADPADGGDGGGSRSMKLREVVKVDLERVDGLVDLIGELVILESMVTNSLKGEQLHGSGVVNHLSQLNKLVRDLQALGLGLRMVPLRGVFQKMARLVRDVSHKAGKSARLVVSGEKTEMDRRLVEVISDPLVHMVRNSVDHGLEPPDERVRLGKPEVGTIQLSAAHDGGNIVIEIADDGRGLNREAILAKAVQKGLIQAGATLADEEVWQLVFAPGFSTAASVTEISGRGVGMDVVKKNIESMRGRITIESSPGKGSVFKLHLPLTLAIISGFIVGVGEERYILPTLSVVESFKPTREMLTTYGDGTEVVNSRGEILPLVRMECILGVESRYHCAEDALLIIVQGTRNRAAILVDDVLGQQNIVIKTLGVEARSNDLFSGAAILSDGRVGLIVNIDEVITAHPVMPVRRGPPPVDTFPMSDEEEQLFC